MQSEGRLYLVFEFVDKDLKKYFEASEGPLSWQLIKSYTYQLLCGLEYCHVRGVMHRDLKPQNILVSRDGRLKIADFGQSFPPFAPCFLRSRSALLDSAPNQPNSPHPPSPQPTPTHPPTQAWPAPSCLPSAPSLTRW